MLRWVHPGDFARGLLYPLRGLAILKRHGGLKRFWVPPIVLTALALTGSILLTVRYADEVAAMIWSAPAREGAAGIALAALAWLLKALTLVVGFGLSLVATIALANLFAAPFNDALSEAVEVAETSCAAPPFSLRRLVHDLGRTLRLELLKLLLYAAVLGPLLIGSWLFPGVGQAVYAVVATLFTFVYLAIDYVDWPAARRGLGVRERLALLSVRPMMALGFGAAVALCLFIPLLNLFFMPLAVAGGTRLFLDLLAYQRSTHESRPRAGV